MPQTSLRNALCYETLLAAEARHLPFQWAVTDEEAAAGLCYTSGTTGNPKVQLLALVARQSQVLGHATKTCCVVDRRVCCTAIDRITSMR